MGNGILLTSGDKIKTYFLGKIGGKIFTLGNAALLLIASIFSLRVSIAAPTNPDPLLLPATNLGYLSEPNINAKNPALAPFYHQNLHWKPFFTNNDPNTEYAWFLVPIDYTDPSKGVLNILASRVHSANANPQGNVIMNPGGPGESGVITAFSFSDIWRKNIGQNYNLISFDPRGIGYSRPTGVCLTDAEQDRIRAMPDLHNDAVGIQEQNRLSKEFALACEKRLGKTYLEHLGTSDVAKDMDILRAALGDPQVNYLGFSYGTFIGTVYAEQFPHRVRTMVLDGVVDQKDDETKNVIASKKGTESALEDFARDCIKNHPEQCPLGHDTSEKGIAEAFHKLMWPYRFKPIIAKDGRPEYESDLMTGVMRGTYRVDFWPTLLKGLAELKQGHADILQSMADAYMARDAKGHYQSLFDMLRLVHCDDGPPLSQREANYIDTEVRKVAPIFDDGLGTGKASLSECSYWPVSYSLRPHAVYMQQNYPFVVVSTTHDPATSYQSGVDLAHQIGANLITVDDSQHTSVMQNACVDALVRQYFEKRTLPGNRTCPAGK